jgi:hypothetical protein
MGRVYRACKAFFQPLSREILPLSTGTPVKPGQTCVIKGRVQTEHGFWPDRLSISNHGTPGGASDWVVKDIKIAGRSQFCQAGDVPGDVFSTKAIGSFVRFKAVGGAMDVDLSVTYIGTHKTGCPFFGALTGMEYDPGLFEIVREALSQALGSASRGISPRSH